MYYLDPLSNDSKEIGTIDYYSLTETTNSIERTNASYNNTPILHLTRTFSDAQLLPENIKTFIFECHANNDAGKICAKEINLPSCNSLTQNTQ